MSAKKSTKKQPDPADNKTAPQLDKETQALAIGLVEDLCTFIDDSPCAYHAVVTIAERLSSEGFTELNEQERFAIEPGGRYFVRRGGSALIAFITGSEKPSLSGFKMAGGHTDSPALKLKPNPEIVVDGMIRLGVEVYGAPILATWSDRDFGLCGRVIFTGKNGELEKRLILIDQPIVCIPNIAIHMNREVNEKGLKLNAQTELSPILGQISENLPEKEAIRHLLADELGLESDSILSFDIYLYDTQQASFGGIADEFIRAPRLDDLAMCHAIVEALIAGADEEKIATRIAICIDSEEIGSQTAQGARSNLLPSTLERIALGLGDDREGYLAALTRSVLISADNAHARHPGYPDQADPQHAPLLNHGPVIKIHASRAYATDGFSAALFEQVCRKAGVPVQRFVNRSDKRSGGTIGSMTSTQLGVPTVDVGNAQYAMHSIREMSGTFDHYYMYEALNTFFTD